MKSSKQRLENKFSSIVLGAVLIAALAIGFKVVILDYEGHPSERSLIKIEKPCTPAVRR